MEREQTFQNICFKFGAFNTLALNKGHQHYDFFQLLKNANTPKGSRTPVFGLRTRCPRPLDDGGVADLLDGTGYHWPFQDLRPKVPETSLSIWPKTSRRPPARRRQTSSSKKKTDSKTKCCKRTCYCPHSSRNNLVNLFSVN